MSGVRGFVACLSTILLVVSVLWIPLADVETGGTTETREVQEEALFDTSSKLEIDPLVQRPASRFTECIGALREEGGRFVLDGDEISVVLGIGWVAYRLQGTQGHVVRVEFVDAKDVEPRGKDPLGHTTYRITRTQDGPRTDRVSSYEEVVYEGLYDGIDLRFHLVDGRLKYDYVVMPGGDPTDIRQVYLGVDGLSVESSSGDLVIETPSGPLSEEAPFAFQDGEGVRSEVECGFRVLPGNQVAFSIGRYDAGSMLVIDPEVVWSTFIGGNQTDGCNGIRLGSDGFIYLSGWTYSPNLPVTPGAFDDTYKFHDAWFAKMDPNGTALEWCTYVSGSRNDYIKGFFVDDYGCIHGSGHTYSKDFPTTEGAYSNVSLVKTTGIAFKLSSDGSKLLYSTTFGWNEHTYVSMMYVDKVGKAYIVGSYPGSNFPITPDSVGDGSTGNIFLLVLDPSGSYIDYSTRIGGGGHHDIPADIFVDDRGAIFITGVTDSGGFPTTPSAYDTKMESKPHGTRREGFLVKIDPSGFKFDFSTLLGGSSPDSCSDLFVDDEGCAWVTGSTESSDFPTTMDAYNMGHHGKRDIFISKFDPTGSKLLYSTLIGGSEQDYCERIMFDGAGNIYIYGSTNSSDLPFTGGPDAASPNVEPFMAKFDPSGQTLRYLEYFPVNSTAGMRDFRMAEGGELHMAGWTQDPNRTITEGVFQEVIGGKHDAFVCKFHPVLDRPVDHTPPKADAGPIIVADVFENISFDGSGSHDESGLSEHVWLFEHLGEVIRITGPRPEFTFEAPGIYDVVLYVTDKAGNRAHDTVTVVVNDVERPVADAGDPIYGEPQLPVTLYGGRSTDDFGVVDYEWTIDVHGVTTVLHGIDPQFTFNATGEFWVRLIVYDISGNWDSDLVNVTLTDYRDPVAHAGYDQEVFANSTVQLNGTASRDNVAVTNWTWTITLYDGNTPHLYGPMTNYTFEEPGTYRIILDVRDRGNHTSTDAVVIEVKEELDSDEPGPSEDIEIPITNLQIFFLVLVILVFTVVILLNAYGGGGKIRI